MLLFRAYKILRTNSCSKIFSSTDCWSLHLASLSGKISGGAGLATPEVNDDARVESTIEWTVVRYGDTSVLEIKSRRDRYHRDRRRTKHQ